MILAYTLNTGAQNALFFTILYQHPTLIWDGRNESSYPSSTDGGLLFYFGNGPMDGRPLVASVHEPQIIVVEEHRFRVFLRGTRTRQHTRVCFVGVDHTGVYRANINNLLTQWTPVAREFIRSRGGTP